MSALLSDALAAYLGSRRPRGDEPELELLVRGKPGGTFPSPAEMSAIEEEEDLASLAVPRTRRRAGP